MKECQNEITKLEDSLEETKDQLKQCKLEEQRLLDRLEEAERVINNLNSQDRMRSKEVSLFLLRYFGFDI